MRSSRFRRVKRTARKSISRALTRMPRSKLSKRSKSKRSNKRSLVEELRETLSLPEVEDEQPVSVSVPKKKKSKKKKKSTAWSAKLHGKGTKSKKGKKKHKKKHKKKKMKGGEVNNLTIETLTTQGRIRESVPFSSFVRYISVNTPFPMKFLVYNNRVFNASGSYTEGEILREVGEFDSTTSDLKYSGTGGGAGWINKDGHMVNKIKIEPMTD